MICIISLVANIKLLFCSLMRCAHQYIALYFFNWAYYTYQIKPSMLCQLNLAICSWQRSMRGLCRPVFTFIKELHGQSVPGRSSLLSFRLSLFVVLSTVDISCQGKDQLTLRVIELPCLHLMPNSAYCLLPR